MVTSVSAQRLSLSTPTSYVGFLISKSNTQKESFPQFALCLTPSVWKAHTTLACMPTIAFVSTEDVGIPHCLRYRAFIEVADQTCPFSCQSRHAVCPQRLILFNWTFICKISIAQGGLKKQKEFYLFSFFFFF